MKLLIVLLLFALDCSAQTLADIARKERERQKNARGNVTTVGVPQGIPATTSAGTSSTTTAPAPAAAAAAKPTGPTDNKGRDEKYWREAFQKARDEAKRAEDQAAVLELNLKQLNTQLLQNSEIYNRENRLGVQINDTQKELDNARKNAEAGKKRIADLEEELRRSNGLPGWAR